MTYELRQPTSSVARTSSGDPSPTSAVTDLGEARIAQKRGAPTPEASQQGNGGGGRRNRLPLNQFVRAKHMTRPPLRAIAGGKPSEAPIIAQAKREAATAALDALSVCAEAQSRLREVADSYGPLLAPAFEDGAPRLADQIAAAVERMTVALKNGGTIR